MGPVRPADLTAAGVTEREIRSVVRSGAWVRLRPGLFVTAAGLAETEAAGRRHELDAPAVATALARPSAALSHGTAARCGICRYPLGCHLRCG
ncbi:type IV toxin-antitoxin system AbiEi family antitoxin domain-containing protein [Modestobacter sp. DSM 44400]|uniref:type IV toxin-antitoxin system AbiEi family antitoxin domain-containing protein n=1 Tax=Modestobacter sp. DSM 44400 TaxID=1550230 RepID=UPI0011153525